MRIGTKDRLRLLAHASLFSVLLSALSVPMTVLAEQRPSIAPAATVPSVWAWFDRFNVGPSGNAALFNGYSTAVEVCQVTWPGYTVRFEPYYSYPGHPYNGITGNCFVQLGGAWVPSGQPSYYQNCPAGYYVPNATMTFLPKLGFSAYFDANQLACQNQDAPNRCPEVAVGETPFVLDPGGLTCSRPNQCHPPDAFDSATGQCVHCPIDPIPELPEDDKDYACTQSLDKGAGKDVDGVCPPINAKLTAWNGEMQCFEKKLAALHPPITYSGPSATIRTEAYQQHLLEIWKKSEEFYGAQLTDAEKLACASRIADVNAQMGSHKIKYGPSSKGGAAPHVQGIAFDVPENVVNSLMERVTMIQVKASIAKHHPGCISCMHIPMVTGDVQDYINSSAINPPACKLDWGGRLFVNPKTKKADTVHFQLQQP